jgi:hypothetical protein
MLVINSILQAVYLSTMSNIVNRNVLIRSIKLIPHYQLNPNFFATSSTATPRSPN